MRSKEPREGRARTRRLLKGSSITLIRKERDIVTNEKRSLRRKRTILLIGSSESPGLYFTGFDIWLVKRVDVENGPSNGSRNLPAEKLLPKIVLVGDIN